MKTLLSFETLIATKIIKWIYYLGLVIILLGAIISLPITFFASLPVGLLLILIWRLICEALIMGFHNHDLLAEIAKNTKHGTNQI